MIACLYIGDSLRVRCIRSVERLYMADDVRKGKERKGR